MVNTRTHGTDPDPNAGGKGAQTHVLYQTALAVLFVAVAATLSLVFLAYRSEWSWQLAVSAGTTAALAITMFGSMGLTRHGRLAAAARSIIAGMLLVSLVLAAMLADIGLVLGLSVVLGIWMVAAQTLPQREVDLMLLVGFAAGVVMGALDVYAPAFQIVVPELSGRSAGLSLLVALVYLVLVAWQFKHYNLRTKLVAVFLLVSMASAGAVAVLSSRTTSEILASNAGANLQSRASVQAVAVGDLLARQVDILQALGMNKTIQDSVRVRGLGYSGSQAEIQARLRQMDQEWAAAADNDILVAARLNPIINLVTSELLEFQERYQAHVEIFVTDEFGALVAATNRTSDYYQADEEWWQAAYNKGHGGFFLSQPHIDESSASNGIIIAVPIYAHETQQVVGVLRSFYNLNELAGLFSLANQAKLSQSDLILPGGRILNFTEDTYNETLNSELWDRIMHSWSGSYLEGNMGDTPSLVGQALVSSSTINPMVTALNWRVVSYQNLTAAQAPVAEQVQAILFLTLVIIGLTAGVAVFMSQRLGGPITRLTAAARQVAAGDLKARAQVETGDEIGLLADTFNSMTGRLNDTIDTLEERVSERTQQIQTVVDVSQRLAGILDLSDLLRQVVNTTKETFGYYHVHIYLLDELGQTLRMAEGYGEAGAEMRRQGHDIPLIAAKSLVARAAREGEIVRVENVRNDPEWLPNPLLPETRSEMAVPVKLGTEVVGVLDVQSAEMGGLTQEDESTLQILANQIAVGVRNARLFSQTQEALYQAQKLQRQYTGQAWEKLAASRASANYEFRRATLPPLQETNPPEAVAALQQEQTVDIRLPKITLETDQTPHGAGSTTQTKSLAALATPLKLRDEIIGVLGVHADDPDHQWSSDEIALIEAVSEQMSLAIENARLFEETGRRAGRERIIAQVTRQVWASGDLERVMQTAVEQLGSTLDASKVIIRLGTEDQLEEARS